MRLRQQHSAKPRYERMNRELCESMELLQLGVLQLQSVSATKNYTVVQSVYHPPEDNMFGAET